MPSKIQLDENLWFLYVCLQKSDFKAANPAGAPQIDFNAVGEATGLKPPAARMRYTRLRRHIVDGTLIGTHGTPFHGGPDRIAQTYGKRKKDPSGSSMKKEEESPGFRQTRSGGRIERPLKSEVETSDEYETDSDNEQDEMPLAKRRITGNARGQIKAEKDFAPSAEKLPAHVSAAQGEPSLHYIEARTMLRNPALTPQPKTEERSGPHAGATLPALANLQNRADLPLATHSPSSPSTSPKTPLTSNDSSDNKTLSGISFPIPNPPPVGLSPKTRPSAIKAEDKDKPVYLLIKEEAEDQEVPIHVLKAREGVVV
ncbi:hypothetical protein FGG08_000025 [Glutinoglossum americanum]|uniref:Myb-like DNA-binding domain-containing protein n=1 Tax=Glutinoglossum americanum TaxID=1670608 RepID=A0A9P8I9X8_9PEZI|nr:hypothetical protein FGG08_000025 [Glutinoglossum americanum]